MTQFWKGFTRLAGLASLSAIMALAQATMGRPGAVNYVEGQATLNGQALNSRSIGSAEIEPGQTIETAQGRVEILLTPGVFLRLDNQSAVQMISPTLTNTEVQLNRGLALVEVDQIERENHLVVVDSGFSTTIEKRGLYAFNANPASVSVYDGKVTAQIGTRNIEVGKDQQLILAAGARKTQKFDRAQTAELYAWSSLRSQYMAEANAASAQTIIVNNPGWFYGTGWYWNPWFDSWAFVPGAGYLYSPFGFGFFSPGYAYFGVPFYRGYWGGFHGYRGPVTAFHGPVGHAGGGFAFHGGGFAGGFHGGGRR